MEPTQAGRKYPVLGEEGGGRATTHEREGHQASGLDQDHISDIVVDQLVPRSRVPTLR